MRHLPRIVSILDGSQEPKNLVRSVFSSVVTTPPQTFGSVSSNMPRVRQSELLTPAELMVLLHESEKEISLKSAKEGIVTLGSLIQWDFAELGVLIAIGICFSMTDVFRSEILAVVMQQIMDEPVLPVLFLRTVGVVCSMFYPLHSLFIVGHSSRHNLQIPCRFRIHNAALPPDNEKNLDKSTTMGRLYPLCESHRTSLVWCSPSATQRSATRAGGQATELESGFEGLCDEEGRE